MFNRIKFFLPVILIGCTVVLVMALQYTIAFICFFLAFGILFFLLFSKNILEDEEEREPGFAGRARIETGGEMYRVYYGDELLLADEEIIRILTKRFPYYSRLDDESKRKFRDRLKRFIADKTFKIFGPNAFREMPVLISAAAIQLTFGLQKFLMPHFSTICIYPEEFMRLSPDICLLEGNVGGNVINLSWKHFLEGYELPEDGQNVGLHEMAHALYYQTFVSEESVDRNFKRAYEIFEQDANKVYDREKTMKGGLYSAYAEKNFQEFWAETVELFFEKPRALRQAYPRLFETIKQLLNQDPLTANSSAIRQ